MTCGRVFAIGLGIALLFPGLCFLWAGIWGIAGSNGLGLVGIFLGGGTLWIAWWLFTQGARDPETATKITPEASPSSKEPSKTEPPKTE
jgi:hypothetical protein